jgi:hypothetical protein
MGKSYDRRDVKGHLDRISKLWLDPKNLIPGYNLTTIPKIWGLSGGGDVNRDRADSLVQEHLGNLSDAELDAILENYYDVDNNWSNLFGIGGYDRRVLDEERLLSDLAELKTAAAQTGSRPLYENFLNDARTQASDLYSGMYADLDALDAERTTMYRDELSNLRDSYNQSRTNLLSQQYQQNAQLMDTLQSGMDRSRRNALESGASAGIRIADNINTLLSVQNKQSATSMETANQLAQMMVNQRNAEASINRDYSDYKTQSAANRHTLQREQEGYASNLANTNYNAAMDTYQTKQNEYDSKYDNPLLGRRHSLSEKYGGGKYGSTA